MQRNKYSDLMDISLHKGQILQCSLPIILLFFFIFAAISYAGPAEDFQAALNSNSNVWLRNIAIASMFGFMLAGLAYMVGSALKSNELNTWAKEEFAEMTGTIFLVAIILLAIGFSDSIFRVIDWDGNGVADGKTPLDISSGFATEATSALLTTYYRGMQVNMILSLMSGAPRMYFGSEPQRTTDPVTGKEDTNAIMKADLPGIPIPIWFLTLYIGGIGYYPYSGTGVFTNNLYKFQSLALMAAGMSALLGVIADFIGQLAIPVLLPMGILLRTFAVSRKMGSTFIAIAVCLYFFFPAAVLISEKMYDAAPKYNPPEVTNPKILGFDLGDPNSMMKPFFGPGSYLKQCEGENPLYFLICLIIKLLQWIYDLLAAIIKMAGFIISAAAPGAILPTLPAFFVTQQLNNAVMGDLMTIIFNYIPHVTSYAVPIILAPVVILVICVSAMRSISPAIGGEVQILGVSDLI